MIPKQDRSPVRTPAHIEQKYDLNKDYDEIKQLATTANRTASTAVYVANNATSVATNAKSTADSTAQGLNTLSKSVTENAEAIAEIDKRVENLEESNESGTSFTTDETLTLKDGVLSVNRAFEVEQDNTLPITSAAVYTEIGNIDVLLQTI